MMIKKALLLGTLITLVTGVWEYEFESSSFGFLGKSIEKFRGIPLPYWNSSLLPQSPFVLYTFLIDIVFWFIISLIFLRILKRVKHS